MGFTHSWRQFLAISLTVASFMACKSTQNDNATVKESDSLNDHTFINDITGRSDLEFARVMIARALGKDPKDPTYDIQFRLFRCSAEAGLAAATGGAGANFTGWIEISAGLMDAAYSLFKTMAQEDPQVAKLITHSGSSFFMGVLRALSQAMGELMTGPGFDLYGSTLAMFSSELSKELAALGVESANLSSEALVQMVRQTYSSNPSLMRSAENLQKELNTNTYSKIVGTGFIILRCAVSIGEGAWALNEEVGGLIQDRANLNKSRAAVTKSCPNFDSYTKCNKTCGGGGFNSQFVKDRAGACKDPAIAEGIKGMVVNAYANSCYELYCQNGKQPEFRSEGQCAISPKQKPSYFPNFATPSEFIETCCDKNNAEPGKCMILN